MSVSNGVTVDSSSPNESISSLTGISGFKPPIFPFDPARSEFSFVESPASFSFVPLESLSFLQILASAASLSGAVMPFDAALRRFSRSAN